MRGTLAPARAAAGPWQPVRTADATVATAERNALGTTARVVVWPPAALSAALAVVDDVLAALDLQASRFRADSQLSWVHRTGGGVFLLSGGLAEAVGVALAAARWTGGRVDPTVGAALIALGYDRDFAAINGRRGLSPAAPVPAPGWHRVRLDGVLLWLPDGIRLDLGATAKGLGADRAARAVMSAGQGAGGVLVSLGGDIATGGIPPQGGWPVTAAGDPGPAARLQTTGGTRTTSRDRATGGVTSQLVRLPGGAVATSSVTVRRWRHGGRMVHHIVDPATGLPADGPWRSASVAAATCADANAAATAAIVAGPQAEQWLAATGLPARLAGRDGSVRHLGGWPAADGGLVPVTRGSRVCTGLAPGRGPR
jgi:thiamine biosynthesis lipoprotein